MRVTTAFKRLLRLDGVNVTNVEFAATVVRVLTPGSLDVHDLPTDLVGEQLPAMNSLVSPWHQWLDPVAYGRHVDDIEAMGLLTAASAHGPVMSGDALHQAFDVVRRLAGQDRPLAAPC